MEKSCIPQEILNAWTLSSYQEDFFWQVCECQDSDLSFEINAFLLVHQVLYANQSKKHPSPPPRVKIESSSPITMRLRLRLNTASLGIWIKTTWYINDYFLKVFHVVQSLHFGLLDNHFLLLRTWFILRIGVFFALLLLILWGRHRFESKSLSKIGWLIFMYVYVINLSVF